MRYHLTRVGMTIIKKIITSVAENMKKRESSYTIGGNVYWFSCMENSMETP